MAPLQFRFFGALEICHQGQVLPKPATLKSQSLLAYLVVNRDRPHARERLAGLFWRDRPERKARHSLATSLWHIRRSLPEDGFLLADTFTVQFDPHKELQLDMDEFEALVSCDDHDSLVTAIANYRGTFLEGFYDDWVLNERYRLQSLFEQALARLMVVQEDRGQYTAALTTAQRLLRCDPTYEGAHRMAMRSYCQLGERNEALNQYNRCCAILNKELDVEPMLETKELHQAILDGRYVVKSAREAPAVKPTIVSITPAIVRSPLDAVLPSILMGRDQELAFLDGCWQEAQDGRGIFTLIRGEAGVGKTRLVEESADHLRRHGVQVFWGNCYEFERLLPYQPIADALGAVLPGLSPEFFSDIPNWVIQEISRLVPMVAEVFQDLARRDLFEPDQERQRLFDGVAYLFNKLSFSNGLIFVLEDIHWITASSLSLIHYLLRHLADRPVLVFGTLRPEAIGRYHPLHNFQAQLEDEGLIRHLDLACLSKLAVEDILMDMSGAGKSITPLAERLYRETEGNPFFLVEIVKALFEAGEIYLSETMWQGDFDQISLGDLPTPDSLNEAIQARVRRLPAKIYQAVCVAAVLGREFDFDMLATVWNQDKEEALMALEVMLRRRLIKEGTGLTARDYAFTHHKIQEVIYAGIPELNRGYVHAHAGLACEKYYKTHLDEMAGELAWHFEKGRQFDKALTDKAIYYMLMAGDQARILYNLPEAIDYYNTALSLSEQICAYDQAARIMMKLGATHHTAFEFQQSHEAYERGLLLWQQLGERKQVHPKPAPHALRIAWWEVSTLDPAMADGIASSIVLEQLFRGLVERSPEGELIPDLARYWEILDEGCRYVFYIRDNLRWSDGAPLTAMDFEYAWKRVLDPVTRSPLASLLYDIRRAKDYHQGICSQDRVGVSALDEITLEVHLESPTGYFLELLTCNATYAVPRFVVEEHGEAWAKQGNIATNGPFVLETWQDGESISLVRNPEYRGGFSGNLERIHLLMFADPSKQIMMYEAGELDVYYLWESSPLEVDRARRKYTSDYVLTSMPCTLFVEFDISRAPFNDMRIRQAFAQAVDRDEMVNIALRGCYLPATGGFLPPEVPGHSPGIGLAYDPERARRLLADAGYPEGYGFSSISFLSPAGYAYQAMSVYLQTQWQGILGVQILGETLSWSDIKERYELNPPHMCITAWDAAYLDPDYFLRTSPVHIKNGWLNETYEELVERARCITNQSERIKLYQQADKIIIDDVGILPLAYWRLNMLIKPWVKQYPFSWASDCTWKDVIIERH